VRCEDFTEVKIPILLGSDAVWYFGEPCCLRHQPEDLHFKNKVMLAC